MLSRRKTAISSIVCVSAVLALAMMPASASAKTKVIGQATKHVSGNIFDFASVTSPFVKKPKRGSLSVAITAVPDNPAHPNQVDISGGMTCPGKGGGAHEVGVFLKHVATPFSSAVPFPFKAKNPKRCRVSVAFVNFDPDPPVTDPLHLFDVPPGTITITILWKTK